MPPSSSSDLLLSFFATHVAALRRYLMENAGGGPRPLQMRHLINLQKGSTFIVMSTCMLVSGNHSLGAYVYTALHGSYGCVWLLKDAILPDANWNAYITIPSSFFVLCGLALYWFPGFHIIFSKDPIVEVSPERAAVAIAMHSLGMVLMMGADTQKFFVLKLRKGLIDDGWVARCRNTNYLGEMMVYIPYAILAQHWLPWTVYGVLWTIVFGANMAEKEVSLRKKQGAEAYVARSGFLFPDLGGWLWDTWIAPDGFIDDHHHSNKMN